MKSGEKGVNPEEQAGATQSPGFTGNSFWRSFFEKAATTGRLAGKEAQRRKLQAVDLRKADLAIGRKAYESDAVPSDYSESIAKLKEIQEQMTALSQPENPASDSFSDKAKAVASAAARKAKLEALKLKQSSLLSELGGRLRALPNHDPKLTPAITAAIAVKKRIEAVEAEMVALRSQSWIKHPLVWGCVLLVLLVSFFAVLVRRNNYPYSRQMVQLNDSFAAEQARYEGDQREAAADAERKRKADLGAVQQIMAMTEKSQREYQQKQEQGEGARKKVEQAEADAQAKQQAEAARQDAKIRREADEQKTHRMAAAEREKGELAAKRRQVAAAIVRTAAKIEQEPVGPANPALTYAVSPAAVHLATATLVGSRSVVVIDGKTGPPFDELMPLKEGAIFSPVTQLRGNERRQVEPKVTNAPVVFSDDGTRFAYAARLGAEAVVMVDGKEFARGPYVEGAVRNLSFLRRSNRVCYIATLPRPANDSGGRFKGTRLVVEGDTNPLLDSLGETGMSLTTDGQHYAYYVDMPPDSGGWRHTIHLVVDGKMDPPQYAVPGYTFTNYMEGAIAPMFTGDCKHLVTVRSRPLPDPETKDRFFNGPSTVFIDQTPILEAPHIEKTVMTSYGGRSRPVVRRSYALLSQIWMAPNGTSFVAEMHMPDGKPRLFLNDTPVGDADKVESVAWSPDGKRYSARCRTNHNSEYMIIDGKRQPEYRYASNVFEGSTWVNRAFTADSSKAVYLARTEREFLVVEDEESEGYARISDLQFSAEGGHIAFIAQTDTGEKMLVVDGKALPPRQDVREFAFVPDGTHYSFLSGSDSGGNRGTKVFIDGVEQARDFGGDFVHYGTSSREEFRQVLFSPDGKHSLYLAAIGQTDTSGSSADHKPIKAVCLDGNIIPCASARSEVTAFFTSDSKHVMWIDWGGKLSPMGKTSWDNIADVGGFSLYVDGQLDSSFESPTIAYNRKGDSMSLTIARYFQESKDAAAMQPDGVLQFFAQVGEVVKRLRVTPAADVTLARFAGIAEERRLMPRDEPEGLAQPK